MQADERMAALRSARRDLRARLDRATDEQRRRVAEFERLMRSFAALRQHTHVLFEIEVGVSGIEVELA